MKRLTVALALCFQIHLYAAETPPAVDADAYSPGSVSIEGLGQAFLYSVYGSYRPHKNFAFNLGLGYFSFPSGISSTGSVVLIPLSTSALLGGTNGHHFEFLAGGTFVAASGTATGSGTTSDLANSDFVFVLGAGYRYWPNEGGLHFRATLYGLVYGGNFTPWPGFSIGYAFQ